MIVDSRKPVSRAGVVTLTPEELPASLTRRVLDACPAPMILFESRANECVVRYINPAFARRTGHSTAELAQIAWDSFTPWATQPAMTCSVRSERG